MLQSFIFGNSNDPTKPVSMEDLRRRQAVVDALAEKASDTSPVGHWSQGLNRVLLGVESGMKEGAIERDTRAAQDSLGKAFGALTGGGGATQPATMATPSGPAPMPPDQIKAIIDATVPEADREYAYRMALKESNFDPAAVSPTGATGLFQFTKGTGRDYGLVGQQGDARSDPALNTQAFVKFTNDNRAALRKALGREPTFGELAVAHQQGAGGAIALLTGQGSVDPRNLAVQAGNPKNAQDIMNYYGFGDGGGRAAVVGAMQGGPEPARVQAAMEVMGSDFATPGQKAVAQAIIEQSMQDPMEGELKRLQIEKARQDLEPRGPEFRTLSDDEERQMGLDPSKAYQMGRNGEIKAVGGGGVTVNTGAGGSDKQVFDAMAASAETARSAATGLNSIREARNAIEGGAILGAGADVRLGLQKVGALLGVADPGVIQNTETFRSAIAPQVAALMKATVGSTQISNSDREFAEKAAGGSISLDAGTIKRLLGIMEKAGTVAINSHMDRLNKVYPDAAANPRERALFEVQMPAAPEPPKKRRTVGGKTYEQDPDGSWYEVQ
jgi:hypothetical protein